LAVAALGLIVDVKFGGENVENRENTGFLISRVPHSINFVTFLP
jgi:hypothetical protein